MQEMDQQSPTQDLQQMCGMCGNELLPYDWHYQECDRCLTQTPE